MTVTATNNPPTLTGRILKNRYEIGQMCGHGGMSHVYRGFDNLLNRPVAIKLLIHLDDMDMIQRFEREAHILSHLNHPHIASIYDFGLEGEQPFMIMELVDGKSLDQFLTEATPMQPDLAISLLLQAGEGLAAAHDHGIVHRDVKPENILICNKGGKQSVRLIDFGLAVTDKHIKSNDRLTMHGFCVGTQRYMSPEQMEGHVPTPATDIYAFGLVCAELLAGTSTILGGRLLTKKTPAGTESFWYIIQKACRETPTQRWSNLREMLAAFRIRTESSGFRQRFHKTRSRCVDLVNIVVGKRRQEKILALASVVLVLFLCLSWGQSLMTQEPSKLTLEKVKLSWLSKNQLRVRVMGMAEQANPTHLYIETSVYDHKGELIPDPTSTVIDKTLQGLYLINIEKPLQSLDKDFRFVIPSNIKKGFVHVKLMNQNRTIVAQEKIELHPPVKKA